MDDVKSKINYLQGLAEGMDLSAKSKEGEILTQMLEAMNQLADKVDQLEREQIDLEAAKKEAENDILKNLGQTLFSQFFEMMLEYADENENPFLTADDDDDDEDEEDDYLYNYFFGEDDEDDDDDDDFLAMAAQEDNDDIYEVICEDCGCRYHATSEDFKSGDVFCPQCHSHCDMPEDVFKQLLHGYEGD